MQNLPPLPSIQFEAGCFVDTGEFDRSSLMKGMKQRGYADGAWNAQQQEPPDLGYPEEENQAASDRKHYGHQAAADCDVVNRNPRVVLHTLNQKGVVVPNGTTTPQCCLISQLIVALLQRWTIVAIITIVRTGIAACTVAVTATAAIAA